MENLISQTSVQDSVCNAFTMVGQEQLAHMEDNVVHFCTCMHNRDDGCGDFAVCCLICAPTHTKRCSGKFKFWPTFPARGHSSCAGSCQHFGQVSPDASSGEERSSCPIDALAGSSSHELRLSPRSIAPRSIDSANFRVWDPSLTET